MKYVKAVQAALRATAPYVAIPVEGHAPACVRAKLLKGALKGVNITSVKIITTPKTTTSDSGRWLEVRGVAEGGVRTYCKMVVVNAKSHNVWKELSAWTDREREKRLKVISQGVLNPAERKALKLKEVMAKEEKLRNAELIAAQREEIQIIEEAKSGVFPPITPLSKEERAKVIREYSNFHKFRSVRKLGSVILWKLKSLRAEVKAMTVEKREYEERPSSGWHRRRRVMTGKKTILRRKGDSLKYAAAVYHIGQLEAQYAKLYPPIVRTYGEGENITRYRVDSFHDKRPREQAYTVPWGWRDTCVAVDEQRDEEGNLYLKGLKLLAVRLRNAQANIRALTPPADEDEQELPLAA
jgi:hypothetical protein